MTLATYIKRLENKPMKEDIKHIQEDKEKLCEELMKLARKTKHLRGK